jgi:hypothetical protein
MNGLDKFTKGPGAKYAAFIFGIIILMCSLYNLTDTGFTWPCGSLSSVGGIITLFSAYLFLYKHDKATLAALTTSTSSSAVSSP